MRNRGLPDGYVRWRMRPGPVDGGETSLKPTERRSWAEAATAAGAAVVLSSTLLGGILLYWLYLDAGVPAAQALRNTDPARVAGFGLIRLAAPAAVVAAATLSALRFGRWRRLDLARRGNQFPILLASVLFFTPLVAYAIDGAGMRADGGLDVGVITTRNTTGDPAIVADEREPGIGPADLGVRCARKRPENRNPGDRPYIGADVFACAGYFIGVDNGYVVLATQGRLHFFPAREVLRLDVLDTAEGMPVREQLGPYMPSP